MEGDLRAHDPRGAGAGHSRDPDRQRRHRRAPCRGQGTNARNRRRAGPTAQGDRGGARYARRLARADRGGQPIRPGRRLRRYREQSPRAGNLPPRQRAGRSQTARRGCVNRRLVQGCTAASPGGQVAGSENSGYNGETGNLADDHAGLPAGSLTKLRARSVRAVMTLRLQGQTLVAGPKAASRNAGIPCCVWPRHFWRLRWLASFHGFFESAAAVAASAPNLPGRPEARTSGPLCLERCTDRCLPSAQPDSPDKASPSTDIRPAGGQNEPLGLHFAADAPEIIAEESREKLRHRTVRRGVDPTVDQLGGVIVRREIQKCFDVGQKSRPVSVDGLVERRLQRAAGQSPAHPAQGAAVFGIVPDEGPAREVAELLRPPALEFARLPGDLEMEFHMAPETPNRVAHGVQHTQLAHTVRDAPPAVCRQQRIEVRKIGRIALRPSEHEEIAIPDVVYRTVEVVCRPVKPVAHARRMVPFGVDPEILVADIRHSVALRQNRPVYIRSVKVVYLLFEAEEDLRVPFQHPVGPCRARLHGPRANEQTVEQEPFAALDGRCACGGGLGWQGDGHWFRSSLW